MFLIVVMIPMMPMTAIATIEKTRLNREHPG
jgi:hypothetical protein